MEGDIFSRGHQPPEISETQRLYPGLSNAFNDSSDCGAPCHKLCLLEVSDAGSPTGASGDLEGGKGATSRGGKADEYDWSEAEDGGVLMYPPATPSLMAQKEDGSCFWISLASRHRTDRKETLNDQDSSDEGEAEGANDRESSIRQDDTNIRPRPSWAIPDLTALLMQSTNCLLKQAAERQEREKMERHAQSAKTFEAAADGDSLLWTSRYAPALFKELLSDDSMNLMLLRWLNAWHPFVFRDRSKTSAAMGDIAMPGGAPPTEPAQRIALITGPPGAGKTTLAHIVARHYRYDVVELNGSVDRSMHDIETAIAGAVADTQFAAPRQRSGKGRAVDEAMMGGPKCLIIDEIDGTSAHIVPLILRKMASIKRPVICLANDLYAPVLRELRKCASTYLAESPAASEGTEQRLLPHSRVLLITLPAIKLQRLVVRLQHIVAKEEDKYDSRDLALARTPRLSTIIDASFLTQLAKLSRGDVRTALNTLQYVWIGLARIAGSGVGDDSHLDGDGRPQGQQRTSIRAQLYHELVSYCQKDSSMNLFYLWQQIFRRQERQRYLELLQEGGPSAPALQTAAAGRNATLYSAADTAERRGEAAEKHRQLLLQRYHQQKSEAGNALTGNKQSTGTGVDPGYEFIFHHALSASGIDYHSSAQLGSSVSATDQTTFIQGLFEFYPKQRYSDYSMQGTAALTESFCAYDCYQADCYRSSSGLFFLLLDLQVKAAGSRCFLVCSSRAGQNEGDASDVGELWASTARVKKGAFTFPREEQRQTQLQQASLSVIKAWVGHDGGSGARDAHDTSRPAIFSPLLSWYSKLPVEDLAADIAPMLVRCLNPVHVGSQSRSTSQGAVDRSCLTQDAKGTLPQSFQYQNYYNISGGVKYPMVFHSVKDFYNGNSAGKGGGSYLSLFYYLVHRHALYGLTYRPVHLGSGSSGNLPGGADGASTGVRGQFIINKGSNDNTYYTLEPPLDMFCLAATTTSSFGRKPTSSDQLGPANNDGMETGQALILRLTGAVKTRGIIVGRADVRQVMRTEIMREALKLRYALAPGCRPSDRSDAPHASAELIREGRNSDQSENDHDGKGVPARTLVADGSTGCPSCTSPALSRDENGEKAAVITKPQQVAAFGERDFFGRPVLKQTRPIEGEPPAKRTKLIETGETNGAGAVLSAAKGQGRGTVHPHSGALLFPSSVRFIHYDGSTNGVKRAANISDF